MTLDLFDPPAEWPPLRKVHTSRAAARNLAPRLTARERQVLSAFRKEDRTPDEAAEYLGVDRTVTRPRCSTMAAKGWLTVTGEDRPTGLGGSALVYRITSEGTKQLVGTP